MDAAALTPESMSERLVPWIAAQIGAAPADEQIAELWERFQRELYELGVRGIVETLENDGVLAAVVTTATDIGWTLTHPDLYQLLVRQRGWSPEDYERWLAETLVAQLVARPRPRPIRDR